MTSPPAALVGFVDNAGLWWLRWLRPGFRHCFVAVKDGPAWIVLDPLSHHTRLAAIAVDDLAGHYRAAGVTVIATHLRPPPPRPAPWRPYTCVEAVKRVLGIHATGIFTPRQLYLWLQKQEKIP